MRTADAEALALPLPGKVVAQLLPRLETYRAAQYTRHEATRAIDVAVADTSVPAAEVARLVQRFQRAAREEDEAAWEIANVLDEWLDPSAAMRGL